MLVKLFPSYIVLVLLFWQILLTSVSHKTESSGRVLDALLRTREVPGSNLGPETGYPELGILCFLSFSPSKFRNNKYLEIG
jgi:hypothetical protein